MLDNSLCLISIDPIEAIKHKGEMSVESSNMHATCRDIGFCRPRSAQNVDSSKNVLRNENNWWQLIV